MKDPTWLEVALNGPWSRQRQPHIPVQADEIVEAALACAGEGASIIHFHAYDPATGRQRDDYEIYAPIIERIRSRADVICYGTLPFAGSVDAPSPLTPAQRFSAVDKLVRAGLIEWSVVDPGSTNISHYADIAAGKEGFVYANPENHIRYGLALAQQHRITPSYAIYEPGFMRLGAALHRAYPGAPVPIYRLMFSQQIAFGFPPTDWALDAYLRLLELEQPGAPWMVAGLGVELGELMAQAVARGGHVRVGLEDAPMGCPIDNRSLAQQARLRIEQAGGRLAHAAQVRERLQRGAKTEV
ncbi:3-keto-5-aminohexanoate cleavage protein [Ramlibacter sp. 2FC]|uniref:3-keto-5-aminohexanoate cleavage protein n=1 Tax=Ramlibacter sp. 2FC TaxID=2502188 RepID=UPI0010F50366|nr:3-keto-5-aminohexanoate cleavage protein [Ramlibacter sp. 2FC]